MCEPNKVDTTGIFNQYQAALKNYFAYVQDCIDGTVANDLQKKINALSANGAITEVKIVSALPADAASHPTTFYWVKG